MSVQANKFKKDNPNIDFTKLSYDDLNLKLPKHIGIVDFKISETSFLIINILNDDSSAVKFFWQGKHDLPSLDLWYKICKERGTFIDVGAHTGLYTITAMKANPINEVICFEPFYLNMARLITNLRLNKINKNIHTNIVAISNFDGTTNFKVRSLEVDNSYLSKGGKISDNGELIKVKKIDSLDKTIYNQPIKAIKIDTEGEDLNVLLGAENTIKEFKPKVLIEVRDENKMEIQKFFNLYNYNLYDVLDLKNSINLDNYNIDDISNVYAFPQ